MSDKPLTPVQFYECMKAVFTRPYDEERAHPEADNILCDLLESLGYEDGVKVFREAEKWYA